MDYESRLSHSDIWQYVPFFGRLKRKKYINNEFVGELLTKAFYLQHNKWFYLPWLISALIFTYTLVYKSLQFWLLVSTNVKTFLPLNILLYSVVGEYFIKYNN